MAVKSGKLTFQGVEISPITMAKDVVVQDLNNLFTAGDLENVLVEVMTKSDISNKVDKVSGMGLSEANYTLVEKNKLAGIENNANNYTHPATHSPSIILQDANNRFVTDNMIAKWNAATSATDMQSLIDGTLSQAKTYTDTSISNVKGLAPSNMDTLRKISAAINNDPSYDLTIKNYIQNKLVEFSGQGSIDVESLTDLSSYTVNVGNIVNLVTNTTTFYKVINSTATTFATRYQVTTTQDKANCTKTTMADAMSLTLANGSYIYIVDTTINKSYECITNDPAVTDFNKKYRILLPDGFVEDKFAALVDGAPATLDTLNELAQALNDDKNFATTVSTQLGSINTSITNINTSITNLSNSTTTKFNSLDTEIVNIKNRVSNLESIEADTLDGGTF